MKNTKIEMKIIELTPPVIGHTYRRESEVSFELPGSELSGTRQFATKGAAKRFIRELRKQHGSALQISRSW